MTRVLSYRGYQCQAQVDFDDHIIHGALLGVNDVVAFHAETPKAFEDQFHDAVDDYLETCAEQGRAPDRAYSGKVMFRIDPKVHRDAAMAAEAMGFSLNTFAEYALAQVSAGVGVGEAPPLRQGDEDLVEV